VLLPFRPTSDTSASRNFVRNFFKAAYEGNRQYTGEGLATELRLTEPLVGTLRLRHGDVVVLTSDRLSAVSSSGVGVAYQAAW
jgi:hypothetical protein